MKTRHSLEQIVKILKTARLKKRLSQRELGEMAGMPQSHISTIENGAVDLKTSSLIELARVLDLEFMLVPRTLVPTVQGLQRGIENSAALQGRDNSVTKFFKNLRDSTRLLEKRFPEVNEIKKLEPSIGNLERLLFASRQLEEIAQGTRTPPLLMEKFLKEFTDIIKQTTQVSQMPSSQINRIINLTRAIQDMRNALAHNLDEDVQPSIPAYRLGR
ncbi:MAG: helix-turn-helix transcriptional regulator [Nitrospinaceae bacterium]|jgi:transcriptional regulator with XRE-family HTH domain|nr:helix-turn-helix transcriptional regulator [Nitrospinaceae bacterium]MBT4095804.1 helix-turn-helix transcriptional regulator [Nitrospinaceae bacterium]MBT5367440.1 helix-turn-helix transcriptional regulator [Nitrospinaceae bacterium]MBT5946484.1 helix-turn-helix transcriptional regulator [Nitrospinaceae bacterium]MBT6395939.1 helix-turn-helix transcriptional regulator [Nitrospinaceae bacterium]